MGSTFEGRCPPTGSQKAETPPSTLEPTLGVDGSEDVFSPPTLVVHRPITPRKGSPIPDFRPLSTWVSTGLVGALFSSLFLRKSPSRSHWGAATTGDPPPDPSSFPTG